MTKPKTPEKWLALPDDKLATELGRAFTKGPWKHCLSQNDSAGVTIRCCSKCDKQWYVDDFPERKPCSVPDPIKLDWNTAKYWQRKCNEKDFCEAIWSVYEAECVHMPDEDSGHWVSWLFERWIVSGVDSTKWLIAAAMVMEGELE